MFKTIFILCALTLSAFAQTNQQVIINVDRPDFEPMQKAQWRILAGNASYSAQDSGGSLTGSGLSLGIERELTQRISLGAQFAGLRTINASLDNGYTVDAQGNTIPVEVRDNTYSTTAYGKFSFVNYPINQWNLLQVNLLGGLKYVPSDINNSLLMYGASVSYNYDNLIGLELSSHVNLRAEASTQAHLIGYF